MRIRKSASRLLGSAYSTSAAPTVDAAPRFDLLPPSPHLAPCSVPKSGSGSGFSTPSPSSMEPCELNRSPWDLIADLSLSDSDQKVEDELMDKYFVPVTTRASWLFSATMPATSTKKKLSAAAYKDSTQLRREVLKRAAMNKEEGETKKKAKVNKGEGQDQDGAARVWMCKKNDGRRWHCKRPVSQPNTLCEYHFVQKHRSKAELEEAAPAPVQAAASKPSTSIKPRKKKKPGNDCSATEGFYYYAGFSPFRNKRQGSGGMNGPLPAKQEEGAKTPEDASHPTDEALEVAKFTNQAACQDDVSSCDNDIAGIAGIDEENSCDDYDGSNMDETVDPKISIGQGKRKLPWKQWRKPVKARSLKSLM